MYACRFEVDQKDILSTFRGVYSTDNTHTTLHYRNFIPKVSHIGDSSTTEMKSNKQNNAIAVLCLPVIVTLSMLAKCLELVPLESLLALQQYRLLKPTDNTMNASSLNSERVSLLSRFEMTALADPTLRTEQKDISPPRDNVRIITASKVARTSSRTVTRMLSNSSGKKRVRSDSGSRDGSQEHWESPQNSNSKKMASGFMNPIQSNSGIKAMAALPSSDLETTRKGINMRRYCIQMMPVTLQARWIDCVDRITRHHNVSSGLLSSSNKTTTTGGSLVGACILSPERLVSTMSRYANIGSKLVSLIHTAISFVRHKDILNGRPNIVVHSIDTCLISPHSARKAEPIYKVVGENNSQSRHTEALNLVRLSCSCDFSSIYCTVFCYIITTHPQLTADGLN